VKHQAELKTDFLFNHPELTGLLAEWHHREWGKIRGEEIADSVALLEMSKSPDQLPLIIIAFENGKPVGMVRLIEHDIPTRKDLTPWLAALYVPPVERNKGVGSFLVVSAVAQARRLGYKKIFLFTSDKIALYAGLGWRLSEIFPHRNHVVAIMVVDVEAQPTEENKNTFSYITHLHNYVYGLKKEAEERGKSILTAAALYTASLVWFIKFATDMTRDTVLTTILTMITIGSGGIGFLFVVLSLRYALKTFGPQVVDTASPMEPLEIVSKPLDEFENYCSSLLTEDGARRALAREIYAVSKVQIRRSAFVAMARHLFGIALLFLVICVFSIIGLYLVRWSSDLGAQWPVKLGQIMSGFFHSGEQAITSVSVEVSFSSVHGAINLQRLSAMAEHFFSAGYMLIRVGQ
jgi:GNAT superfamily N-acetyltransferase